MTVVGMGVMVEGTWGVGTWVVETSRLEKTVESLSSEMVRKGLGVCGSLFSSIGLCYLTKF